MNPKKQPGKVSYSDLNLLNLVCHLCLLLKVTLVFEWDRDTILARVAVNTVQSQCIRPQSSTEYEKEAIGSHTFNYRHSIIIFSLSYCSARCEIAECFQWIADSDSRQRNGSFTLSRKVQPYYKCWKILSHKAHTHKTFSHIVACARQQREGWKGKLKRSACRSMVQPVDCDSWSHHAYTHHATDHLSL